MMMMTRMTTRRSISFESMGWDGGRDVGEGKETGVLWDRGGRKAEGISFLIIFLPLLFAGTFFFIVQHFGNWLVVVLVAADMQHLRCLISVLVQQSYLPFLPNRRADLKL